METCNDWTETGRAAALRTRGPLSIARDLVGNIWNGIHAVQVSKQTASLRMARLTTTTVQGWSTIDEVRRSAEFENLKARAYMTGTVQRQVLR